MQRNGEPAQPIADGDVVRIPAGVEHWHGAARDASMTHLAVQAALDGRTVQWGGPVTDDQYPR